MNELYKINKNISSGRQIQTSYDDSSLYSDVVRLENEEKTLSQASDSAQKALSFSTNTDTTLNQLQTTLDSFKTKLIRATNAEHDETSLDAIASDLEGMKKHMLALANTSINGQYLFAGTAVTTKPMQDDGSNRGNDKTMKALVGSEVELAYNIDGKSLFYGVDNDYNKKITTNVRLYNQTLLHPVQNDPYATEGSISEEKFLTSSDTIRDLMGDTYNIDTNDPTLIYI
jgi:flagellar hook-associated protein 3 FlgL